MITANNKLTMLSRRSFLAGVISASCVASIAGSFAALPVIVGDGVHNDGPGLNALFNGDPVSILADGVRIANNGEIWVTNGRFFTRETLVFRNKEIRSFLFNNEIDIDPGLGCAIDFRAAGECRTHNNVIHLRDGVYKGPLIKSHI